MTDETRIVLLRDADGHTYLLPWRTLERARLVDDEVRRLEGALGEEVAGFGTSYFTGRLLTASDLRAHQGYAGATFRLGRRYIAVRLQEGPVQSDVDQCEP